MTYRTSLAAGAAMTALAALVPSDVLAEPDGPNLFCEAYPEVSVCTVGAPACTYCHDSPDPDDPTWNAYGEDVRAALDGAPFDTLLTALADVADLDSDGDGFTNEEEIEAGTEPGDPASAPAVAACPEDSEALLYRVCEYDPIYAFRKVRLDFCGAQPRFAELEAFAQLDPEQQIVTLDSTLDACLKTAFWRGPDGVLWQLAYPKVRPVHALKAGPGPSPIESLRIADYDHDLSLFAYTQLDDHDARDVLQADYFVEQDGTTYTEVAEIGANSNTACSEDSECSNDEVCYQNTCRCAGTCLETIEPERRQGLLTTRWVALYSTMFSAIPRNTAAQAYRAFLRLDIAKQQGLFPAGEPADYDAKGVAEETCAVCHSTLDPLSYPFTRYQGFGPNRARYYPERMTDGFFEHEGPDIAQTPEAGVMFGQPVADLGEWADVATQSDAFAKATVHDYWRLAMGREPTPDEAAEFTTLWHDFRDLHAYRVEAMLHDLIKTEAYGAP